MSRVVATTTRLTAFLVATARGGCNVTAVDDLGVVDSGAVVRRRHLCVLLDDAATGPVQRWRHRWDPVMAALVPAHVTVVYPEEVVDEDLLLRRAESCFTATRPFRLRLGEVIAAEGGAGGVFVAVDDVDGGWADLRRRLLTAPMNPAHVPAHVTVSHPRTSALGPECWAALAGQRVDVHVLVEQVCYTETTGDTYTVERFFPLSTRSNHGF